MEFHEIFQDMHRPGILQKTADERLLLYGNRDEPVEPSQQPFVYSSLQLSRCAPAHECIGISVRDVADNRAPPELQPRAGAFQAQAVFALAYNDYIRLEGIEYFFDAGYF